MVIMDMHRHTYTDIVIFCTDNNYLIRELPAVLFLGFIEGPTCKAPVTTTDVSLQFLTKHLSGTYHMTVSSHRIQNIFFSEVSYCIYGCLYNTYLIAIYYSKLFYKSISLFCAKS